MMMVLQTNITFNVGDGEVNLRCLICMLPSVFLIKSFTSKLDSVWREWCESVMSAWKGHLEPPLNIVEGAKVLHN